MRTFWFGTAVVALLVAGTLVSQAQQKSRFAKKAPAADSALIKHGEYLVNKLVLCGDCHTPHNKNGQPDETRAMQGGALTVKPKKETKNWVDPAPDITASGLAGEWREEDLVKFLMTGKDPDGMKARPPMPAFRMNERDARAVALYLRTLPGKKR
jgi:mono/diheme cytochrome c family protein